MIEEQIFIKRCFELARLAIGRVNPNPLVGAIIVNNGMIISEGYHQFYGGPHAEVNAISAIKDKQILTQSTLYVSLEPCNNYGKTPPCVDAILRYKIPKVVISTIDQNPTTMGQSIKKLKDAGVQVKINVLQSEGEYLVSDFFTSIKFKRPYIILKFAKTVNDKIGIYDKNIWISNAYTKRLTHKWRSEINAIIVGSKTLIVDNPRLDNRLYFGNSPIKILLKRDGLLPPSIAAWHSKGKKILVSEKKNEIPESAHYENWRFAFDENLLSNILQKLHKQGIQSLLVEGGATLIQSFIDQNLWDESRVYISPNIITDKDAIDAPKLGGIVSKKYQIARDILEIRRNYNVNF